MRSSAPYSVPDDIHQHLDFGKDHFFVSFRIFVYLDQDMGFGTDFFSFPQLEGFIASLPRDRTSVNSGLWGGSTWE